MDNFDFYLKQTQKIIEGALDAIIVIDAEGTILIWNPKAEATFGWTSQEALGKKISDLIIPHEYREAHLKGIRHYLKTGEGPVLRKQIEISALHRNGREFPIELSITPSTHNGNPVFHGFIRDITERKESESQILKAKERAEKADQIKSQFLSRMSHQFRTPLHAILGFTQLLEMNPESKMCEEEKENLKKIKSSGKQLLDMVDQVLDLSQMESRQLVVHTERVDILPIIKSIPPLCQTLAEEKSIDLIYNEMVSGPCYCEVDPHRLKQILLNLISNAIKFNKAEGFVWITVEHAQTGMARISVKDTGHGISEEDQRKLFDPFETFELHEEVVEGAGIGLCVSKFLIEMMNGTIDFESQTGKGTRFVIELPVA